MWMPPSSVCSYVGPLGAPQNQLSGDDVFDFCSGSGA